jgi:hypothetical protein
VKVILSVVVYLCFLTALAVLTACTRRREAIVADDIEDDL